MDKKEGKTHQEVLELLSDIHELLKIKKSSPDIIINTAINFLIQCLKASLSIDREDALKDWEKIRKGIEQHVFDSEETNETHNRE